MEFFVTAPSEMVAEPKPIRGGAQKKIQVTLRIFDFPSMTPASVMSFNSAYEASKFAECYGSRSNLASKLKRDGTYISRRPAKLLLFELVAGNERG